MGALHLWHSPSPVDLLRESSIANICVRLESVLERSLCYLPPRANVIINARLATERASGMIT